MMGDYFSLALGNLKHRGLRSWLTILGVFIGIAAVVSLISLGQGLERAITSQFSSLSTDTLVITSADTGFGPPGSTAVRKLTSRDEDIIKSINGISLVVPRLIRVAKVEYNDRTQFSYLASLPNDKEQIKLVYRSVNIEVEEGKLLDSIDRGKVLLGHDFKTNNGFGKDIRAGSRLLIQGKSFEVAGILRKSSTFQVNFAIIMPEEDMKDILNIGDEIDIIVAKVEDENRMEEIAYEISKEMRRDRKQKEGEEDFSVQTPLEALSSVKTILNIINLIVTGIASISLLIGAVGIANTMFTSVVERTKEIGVMKAVGAKNSDVLILFLIESGLLGLVGGIVGAIIGLSLALFSSSLANSYFGENLFTVTISYPLLFGAISLAFVLGMMSGIIPAYQASKLNPVEALRK